MSIPIPFRGFDERGDVRVYKHDLLPHWRQEGRTYFVTFRLADSLPQAVLREIEEGRRRWLEQHGVDPLAEDWREQLGQLSWAEKRDYERRVSATLNERLDRGLGSCVLRDRAMAEFVSNGLTHFHGERLWVGDLVVMPNHIHALMTPISPFGLEEILKSIKGFTAWEINRARGTSGAVWQRESYDHIVWGREQLSAYQRYIEQNPSKAGLAMGDVVYRDACYCFEDEET